MSGYPANTAAQDRQQKWECQPFSGYFATKTGGETSTTSSTARDGGAVKQDVMTGPAATSNLVLTRIYRPASQGDLIRALEKALKRGGFSTTVTGHDTDPDLDNVGRPWVYPGARLIRIKRPDHDANGTTTGMLELEFVVPGLA